jgi:hypothetical protein
LTVTGKAAADAVPDGWLLADVVLLADEPQAARAVAQAAAAATRAASRRGVLIRDYFLPERREGRRDRRSAGWRPRRITLPTRADVVKRAGVDLA